MWCDVGDPEKEMHRADMGREGLEIGRLEFYFIFKGNLDFIKSTYAL